MGARCIDFVYYYPAQPIPLGMCGIGSCNGSFDNVVALGEDSTLNRTFGIVDTCDELLEEVNAMLIPWLYLLHNEKETVSVTLS